MQIWKRALCVFLMPDELCGCSRIMIAKYIRNQLQEDVMADQLSFKEYLDPFDPDKNPKSGKKPKAWKQAALAAAWDNNAVARSFDAPLGAASNVALKARCIPPA